MAHGSSLRGILSGLGLLATVVLLSPAAFGQGTPSTQTANAKAISALDRVFPEVTFDGVGLSDVFDFLRDVSGANLFVNWKRLEEAGVKPTTPVTAKLRNVKFSKVLAVILDDVSNQKTHLAYAIEDGVITISTADDLKKNTVTHVYDIRDLISGRDPAGKSEALVKMITGSIDRTTWAENGGNTGTVKSLNGQLIVVQTPENQAAIENLLSNVRLLLKSDKAP